MGILFQDKKIGLALLCDNAPYTLAMTLASYERTGLLDYLDAACVVYPEGGGKVEHTARVCGIPAVPSSMEGGFVGALATAVTTLDTDYVLLAEDDCMVWEHLRGETLEKQLKQALGLLVSGQADMVRLRHAWRGSTRYKAAYTYSYFYPVEQLGHPVDACGRPVRSPGLDQKHAPFLPPRPFQAFHRPLRLCGTEPSSAFSPVHQEDRRGVYH